jgi:hypothetical protein
MDLPTLPTYLFEPNLVGVLSLVLTIVLPLVVGLLTRPGTPAHVKGVVLLFVAGVKAVIEAFLAGGPDFNLATTIYTVGINFAIAVVMYFGLLRGSPPQVKAQNSGIR